MGIISIVDFPGGTTAEYDRVNEIILENGGPEAPDGLVQHICGVTDDGILIVDVWDSPAAMQAFFDKWLMSALIGAGVTARQPQITKLHNMIPQGAGTEPNVVMLIELDAGPDVYDQLITHMDAHVADGSQHPCYSHAAGAKEDGGMLVVDLWESPEAFGRFAAEQIAPAAGDRLGEIDPRFVKVHHVVRGVATADA